MKSAYKNLGASAKEQEDEDLYVIGGPDHVFMLISILNYQGKICKIKLASLIWAQKLFSIHSSASG